MTSTVTQQIIERSDRRPLFVQVVTRPTLADCWSVNISQEGIGLVAAGEAVGEAAQEGDLIDLELTLPESGASLEARGRIASRQAMGGSPAEPTPILAIGVAFETMAPEHRLELARFLAEYRFRVVVCGATLGQRDCLARALGNDARLEVFSNDHELLDGLATGDVAALVACSTDAEEATPLIERYATHLSPSTGLAAPLRDLGARLLYYGPAHASDLVRLFNEGKVVRALPLAAEAPSVRAAVLEACRDYGVRSEQRRTALALARALLRERARTRPRERLARAERQIVSESQEMRAVLDLARSIAVHRVGVLLQGETGTGKEVFAHVIHELSDRAGSAFVVQDCGTLTETLLDSELFGHVKGAFTGAVSDHPGLFVLADGGTVFLDEIENTTPALQAKLLRILETGEVRPVGGTKVRKVDVRVICATNRDLAEAARDGHFRSDLFYRLNTFPISLPPLRTRREDIVPLARHFLRLAEASLGIAAGPLSDEVQRALCGYAWPGNVRELKNVMERSLVLSRPGQPIDVGHLPRSLVEESAASEPGAIDRQRTLQERVETFEREVIERALGEAEGVLQRAAEALGMNRITLARKAKRYGVYRGRGS